MNVRAYVDIGEMEKTKKYIFSQSGYKLKCIFHKEQTPSAHITEDGRYVCFGCGVKMKARLNKKVITDNGIIDGDFYEIYSEQ
jgi:DNA primase